MNIAAWSFGRLVGFWCIGLVAELMLIAAPVAYGAVYAWRHHAFARPVASYTYVQPPGMEAVRIGRRHAVEVVPLQRRDEVRAMRVKVQAQSMAESQAFTETQVLTETHAHRAVGLSSNVGFELRPVSALWLPFAAVYLLTIPVGLVVISIIWIASRGQRPPESPA